MEIPREGISGAALGDTVKSGLDRAGALAKDAVDKTRDALSDYLDGGQLSEDLAKYVRSQPTTALLVATGVGVGLLLGMLLVLSRKAEAK